MFIPESMKKEAIRAVKRKIEEEIVANLSIKIDSKPYNNPWEDGTAKVTATLSYKDKEISSDSVIV